MLKIAQYTISSKSAQGFQELAGSERRRDEPPEGEHYERYESHREELGNLADGVADAYDELIELARRKLPASPRS